MIGNYKNNIDTFVACYNEKNDDRITIYRT
jgi:hypothetical protein